MSRSYRLPYSAVTGVYTNSAEDKRLARRAARRKQNQWLKTTEDFEDSIVPHRLECSLNDVWGWGRDGKQRLELPSNWAWSDHCRYIRGDFRDHWEQRRVERHPDLLIWPPAWYARLKRK